MTWPAQFWVHSLKGMKGVREGVLSWGSKKLEKTAFGVYLLLTQIFVSIFIPGLWLKILISAKPRSQRVQPTQHSCQTSATTEVVIETEQTPRTHLAVPVLLSYWDGVGNDRMKAPTVCITDDRCKLQAHFRNFTPFCRQLESGLSECS
jgi:hypothetical protein